MKSIETTELLWNKRKIQKKTGSLEKLKELLPEFSKDGWYNNEYLDVIIRQPIGEDRRTIPVAAVSKTYALIGHIQILEIITNLVLELKLKEQINECTMITTEYCELMKLNIPFKEYLIFKDDAPLIEEIACVNSVDQSTSLEISIVWNRNNCEFYFSKEDKLKLIHTSNKMDTEKIKEFLRKTLKKSANTVNEFIKYYNIKPDENIMKKWLNEDVNNLWGVKLRDRLEKLINTTGEEVIEKQFDKEFLNKKGGKLDNLYHIYQALIWIASDQTGMESQFKKQDDAIDLFDKLLKRIENKTFKIG